GRAAVPGATVISNERAPFGSDTITDFAASGVGQDRINVAEFNITYAGLTIAADGDDTVITIGTYGTIRLQDVAIGDIDQTDFIGLR
ncbi:MAG: hypothetical protein ACRCYS_20330, partial [Beijerinckiaceae bacterium]